MKRDWLIQLRKSKQLTQKNVADRAIIDRAYYAQIETGVRNPSFSVAINIAKVLEFDPVFFFQDILHHRMPHPPAQEIARHFSMTESGNILYLYHDLDRYLHHAVTFLITGMAKGSHTVLIDNHENLSRLKQKLDAIIHGEDHTIVYLHNEKTTLQEWGRQLDELRARLDPDKPLRVWLHEEQENEHDLVQHLQNTLEFDQAYSQKMFSVTVLNASTVSAAFHIELMRKYPYLMTDLEIVYSPLYHSTDNSIIFPSLSQQEKL